LDRQIKTPGPSLILTDAMLRRLRRRADTSNDHQEYLEGKRCSLTRTRQKLSHRYTLTTVCSPPSDYSRESVRSNSRERDRTDSGKRLSIWFLARACNECQKCRFRMQICPQCGVLPLNVHVIRPPSPCCGASLRSLLFALFGNYPCYGDQCRFAVMHLKRTS
jgi:ribosomal protein L32